MPFTQSERRRERLDVALPRLNEFTGEQIVLSLGVHNPQAKNDHGQHVHDGADEPRRRFAYESVKIEQLRIAVVIRLSGRSAANGGCGGSRRPGGARGRSLL